jgi:hypothetical protein
MTNKSNPSKKGKGSVQTTVIIRHDCGFSNCMFIRGRGCKSLSWDTGTKMHNVNASEWIWETDEPFEAIFFKVLINDREFELGEDHQLICGNTLEYSPRF